jgi:hypothetical protein
LKDGDCKDLFFDKQANLDTCFADVRKLHACKSKEIQFSLLWDMVKYDWLSKGETKVAQVFYDSYFKKGPKQNTNLLHYNASVKPGIIPSDNPLEYHSKVVKSQLEVLSI